MNHPRVPKVLRRLESFRRDQGWSLPLASLRRLARLMAPPLRTRNRGANTALATSSCMRGGAWEGRPCYAALLADDSGLHHIKRLGGHRRDDTDSKPNQGVLPRRQRSARCMVGKRQAEQGAAYASVR